MHFKLKNKAKPQEKNLNKIQVRNLPNKEYSFTKSKNTISSIHKDIFPSFFSQRTKR